MKQRSKAKHILLAALGALLVAVGLAWSLLKGTEPVRSAIEPGSVLAFVCWGAAWLCLLGGSWLLAGGTLAALRGGAKHEREATDES